MRKPGAILLLSLAGLGCATGPGKASEAQLITGRTRVIAHRGGTGPDGTVVGCERSLKLGVTFLELDVRVTRDGRAVILHDPTVDRTTNGRGRIDAMTLAELKRLDAGAKFDSAYAGERVPTVAEVLRAVGQRGTVLLELKVPGAAEPVIEAIRGEDAFNRAVVRTADPALLRKIKKTEPRVLIGTMGRIEGELDAFAERLAGLGVSAFTPRQNARMTASAVRALHASGIAAWGTNTNDAAAMIGLIEAGVDGIITDRPELLLLLLVRTPLEFIRPSQDGTGFVRAESGKAFKAWGVNYDHDASGRLLEDYWHEEWPTVVEDFVEIQALGANVVRIHLQLAKFMDAPDAPNEASLRRLGQLVALAERTGLTLDVTGLGCYHKKDVPAWYDALDEAGRWRVQVRFWEAVAKVCAASPAIFCYDLMNEPILPGPRKPETEWLAGAFAGKHFVQRITLDLAGRTREQVAKLWVDTLVRAIRKHDRRHMITVGVIPWALTFPKAKPIFYSKAVGENLDFASVHFYPRKGEVEEALTALAAYEVGKPLVIEETFPLKCGQNEMAMFIEQSRKHVDGWISFYWGETIEDLARKRNDLPAAIFKQWLEWFRAKAPGMRR